MYFRNACQTFRQQNENTLYVYVALTHLFVFCCFFDSLEIYWRSTLPIYGPRFRLQNSFLLLHNNAEMLYSICHLKRCGKASLTLLLVCNLRDIDATRGYTFSQIFFSCMYSYHSNNELSFILRHLLQQVLTGSLEQGAIWMRLTSQFWQKISYT